MNKEESLALWAQGKEAWNAWAQGMLERRAEMEKAGTWAARRNASGHEEPSNKPTREWFAEATADFAGHAFDEGVIFSNCQFPGSAIFKEATFSSTASFSNAKFGNLAMFESATFSRDANFGDVTFSDVVWFYSAKFSGIAWFTGATFNGDAWFAGATFSGEALFNSAAFSRVASFGNTTFSDDAVFKSVTFGSGAPFISRGTSFDGATFRGNATFDQACFIGSASFARATFSEAASFAAGQSESKFSLAGARFSEVPDFTQSHFAEVPRLDDVRVKPGKAGPDRAARYRALKRFAIQGHDHAREQEYFAGELKALRDHPDRLLPNPLNWLRKDGDGRRLPVWPGGARYWFGLGYQLFSDFGRSMLRPLGWWLLAVFGFAAAYLDQHYARATTRGCLVGDGNPFSAAIGLSIRKALPFAGVGSSEKLNQIYACLYGVHNEPLLKSAPVIPDVVDGLGIFQSLFSIVWLFLFLLAVRNHFRIK